MSPKWYKGVCRGSKRNDNTLEIRKDFLKERAFEIGLKARLELQ